MKTITDEFMREMISKTKIYSVVILKSASGPPGPEQMQLVWEHARRNFALRAEGVLSIVCPIADGTGVSGIGIFNCDIEATRIIMDEDPAVKAGIFQYEIHPCRSFPGDVLPGN
jgi:hypothetical protein